MAIEGINITLDQVLQTAKNIKSLNVEISARLEDIKKEMNSLESTWQSEAATIIRKNFNKLESRFQECKEIINSYGTFLENTVVNSYSTTEESIKSNANAFE